LKKRWALSTPSSEEMDLELSEFRPIERVILYNRGIRTLAEANAYFDAGSMGDHDPFQMTGMKRAVERLSTAIRNLEPIVIYGDYDADGITATSLLLEVFRELGGSVEYYIPDRKKDTVSIVPRWLKLGNAVRRSWCPLIVASEPSRKLSLPGVSV
jgi:single-stranded-DNA-specific exonuclease